MHNEVFNIESSCFFCGVNGKKKKEDIVVSDKFFQSVKNAAEKRNNDEWAEQVTNRICSDEIGVKAVFHTNCRIAFRTNKPNPNIKKSELPKTEYRKGFSDIINLIQSNEKNQYSIHELIDEMNIFSDGNAYSFNQMKANMQKHFGDEVIISSVKNKKTLVTLRTKCYDILNEFYESSRNDNEKEKELAIHKVASYILGDIKKVTPNKDFYPSMNDFTVAEAQQFMPKSLTMLLNEIVNGNGALLKIASIGHAIIQTNHRENVMSPLQIGLAAQMYHYTASRYLIFYFRIIEF